jgi:hypothetical protein
VTAALLDGVNSHITQMLPALILRAEESVITGLLISLDNLRDRNGSLLIILMDIVELRMGMENVIDVVDQILGFRPAVGEGSTRVPQISFVPSCCLDRVHHLAHPVGHPVFHVRLAQIQVILDLDKTIGYTLRVSIVDDLDAFLRYIINREFDITKKYDGYNKYRMVSIITDIIFY